MRLCIQNDAYGLRAWSHESLRRLSVGVFFPDFFRKKFQRTPGFCARRVKSGVKKYTTLSVSGHTISVRLGDAKDFFFFFFNVFFLKCFFKIIFLNVDVNVDVNCYRPSLVHHVIIT